MTLRIHSDDPPVGIPSVIRWNSSCVIIAISIKSCSMISVHNPLKILMNPQCRCVRNVANTLFPFFDTVSFVSCRVTAVLQSENSAAAASPMPRYARSVATHRGPHPSFRPHLFARALRPDPNLSPLLHLIAAHACLPPWSPSPPRTSAPSRPSP